MACRSTPPGYLQSQFLTPHTNRRVDDYGGGTEGRTKFLREVVCGIKAACGADYPVIVKLNGSDYLPLRNGLKTEQLVDIAVMLEKKGIDAVEITVGHYESGFPMVRGTFIRCLRNMVQGSMSKLPFFRRWAFRIFWPLMALLFDFIFDRREGFNLAYARKFKARLTIPVICVGGFRTLDSMQAAIEQGSCDIVSAGRAFIADPLLYAHLRDNKPGPVCVDCNACIGHLGA